MRQAAKHEASEFIALQTGHPNITDDELNLLAMMFERL